MLKTAHCAHKVLVWRFIFRTKNLKAADLSFAFNTG
jgi:hypothetical protein